MAFPFPRFNRVAPAVSSMQFSLRVVEEAETELGMLLTKLDTYRYGLTAAESRRRLKRYGWNDVTHEAPLPWYRQFLKSFNNPFVYLLLGLAIAASLTRQLPETLVLLGMVFLSGVLRFIQEYRSTQAAAKLWAIAGATALISRYDDLVPRERQQRVPIRKLVPGDIVHLSAGDMVPADVRLLQAEHLFVSQAILTGESNPVQKHDTLGSRVEKMAIRYHQTDDPFQTPTVCFMGTTVIGGRAKAVVVATGNQTYLGSLSQAIAGKRARTSFETGINRVTGLLLGFIAVLVPIVLLINSINYDDWNESFLFAIAVAVGLVPEMLPLVVSANLVRGATALSKQNVLVKRLDAMQNLGAVDILCTDKTGTLTQNHISLMEPVGIDGTVTEEPLRYAYLNSYHQTGIRNALDAAILECRALPAELNPETAHAKLGEIPFDFVRRRLSVVVEQDGVPWLICKGAVAEVITLCTTAQWQGQVVPLTPTLYQETLQRVRQLQADGLRVLAVAYRRFSAPKERYSPDDEVDLTLVGYVTFLDPPKTSAKAAITALQEHGVAVKVITGDEETITRRICQEVGVAVQQVYLGASVERMTDAELADAVEEATIFARMSPAQKARVIRILKQAGHTVGYLGDGINDALALRDADVGISVDTAADVAKESADIILLEKSLMVLEQGIMEGRRTFGNLTKYLKMATSSNFGNVFSVVGASAFLPFLPMLPLQLLVQNLLYDLSQIAIPFDRVDATYLAKPQAWSASDLRRFMLHLGPVSSVFDYATFALLWFGLGATTDANAALFQSGWFVQGLLSQTLIIHLLRTEKIPFLQSTATLPVLVMTGLVMVIALLLPFTSLGATLGLVPLPAIYFPWLIVILVGYGLLTQIVKMAYIRRFKAWL
ncbi:MAG: magnesium-translocating P-type ATPase [Synechococcales cyanobacterium M58_A2018_015]|nr:magnesium-translocating P-type ATPase [Synechococcales cyanobacterium M58_A2018_015]